MGLQADIGRERDLSNRPPEQSYNKVVILSQPA